MDIIRIVNRIEWITNSRWWLLAVLLLISTIIPVLAVAEITAIAYLYWLTRHQEPEREGVAETGDVA